MRATCLVLDDLRLLQTGHLGYDELVILNFVHVLSLLVVVLEIGSARLDVSGTGTLLRVLLNWSEEHLFVTVFIDDHSGIADDWRLCGALTRALMDKLLGECLLAICSESAVFWTDIKVVRYQLIVTWLS